MINQEINIKLNKGGYYFPLEVLTNEDAIKLNKNYHKIKTIHAKKNLLLEHKFKSHLLFTGINELIRNKKILDIAEKFIGPNILCWNSIIFYKKKIAKLL